MQHIEFKPIWFDSLGAKSACTLVKTPDISILIDPGVAVMQPSFPAPEEMKVRWARRAERLIRRASEEAEAIIISHYHYDHFTDFDEKIYRGKLILAKDPNEYINDSQRKRAEKFYDHLSTKFGRRRLEELMKPRKEKTYPDPMEDLPLARSRRYGDYEERKRELLRLGKRWFRKRVERWNKMPLIPEMKFKRCEVRFADGRSFRFGGTEVRFTKPQFHGIEYARVGWVISTIITCRGEKLIHTSDLEGPVIEDQAQRIIDENPDILIVDGPSTYLIPYMLNLINLRRAIENMCRIIEETDTKLIIYDHHLPREPRYPERVKKVYESAKRRRKKVLTAAEYMGKRPVVLSRKT
ncbi:MAG: MBL fold metallo-hydrolase [Candidatus Wolframiiraptor sp. EX4484-121]|nr:MAG: MBL fold metallo-hydrolase [Candidatus Wolframiiraptor sp. EX4484-121]